jgi:hypothetical protein
LQQVERAMRIRARAMTGVAPAPVALRTPLVKRLALDLPNWDTEGRYKPALSLELESGIREMRIIALLSVACVSLSLVAGPQPASALPGLGLSQSAKSQAAGANIDRIEFRRRPDGSVWYQRPDPNSQGPYLFYYRGFAYPYYPGYTYRLSRGELRPYDRPHRVKVVE